MTARTRSAMKTQATSLIDTTGQGGTTGAEIESLIHDLADSATFPADGIAGLTGLTDSLASKLGAGSLISLLDATPWRFFYSAANGDVLELPIGTAGRFLRSNGATAVPSWEVTGEGAASGDMTIAVYDPQGVSGDAFDRANHTGTQAISTVESLVTELSGKAATAHAHAGGDITSGTVAAERLGSGATTNTTYLRGDNTWGTISVTPELSGNLVGDVDLNGFLIGGASGTDFAKLAGLVPSTIELNYVQGATSNLQTQINGKISETATADLDPIGTVGWADLLFINQAGINYTAPWSEVAVDLGLLVWGGALGTPSSGSAVNLTGLPIVAGTTGTLSLARGGTGGTTGVAAITAFLRDITPTVLTDGATVTPNFGTNRLFTWTIGGNRILANPTGWANNDEGYIVVTQNGTGGWTPAYGSGWVPIGPVVYNTDPNGVSFIVYVLQNNLVYFSVRPVV